MVVRPLRVACLALAAWAVLFAPGAAGADVQSGGPAADSDRVAAAMVAPTFGTDALVAARQARTDQGSSLLDVDAMAPAAISVLSVGGLAVAVDRANSPGRSAALLWWRPSRGPPLS